MQKTNTKIESLDKQLGAAHGRLERELMRLVAGDDRHMVTLRVDGNLTYPFDGRVKAVSWFDLITYGEGLKQAGIADAVDFAYPAAFVHLSADGRSALMQTDFFRLMKDRDYVANAAPEIPPPASIDVPTDVTIMTAVVDVLVSQGSCRQGVLVERISHRLRSPIDRAISGDKFEEAAKLRKALDRSLSALFRVGLIEKKGKSYYATKAARTRSRNGTLTMPDTGKEALRREALEAQKNAVPIPRKVKANPRLVSKSVEELAAMWKNAVAIVGNPLRRPQHAEAGIAIAEVTLEWQRRLDEMNAGRFPWPSTAARGGNGRLSFDAVQSEGMLAFMEYHVGRTHGEPEGVRRVILTRVFEATLPPVFPKEYMAEWGENGSVLRLQKMAFTIAAFVRNVKRRKSGDFSDAIRDWESDLEWLRKTFYVNRFRFALGWPDTKI